MSPFNGLYFFSNCVIWICPYRTDEVPSLSESQHHLDFCLKKAHSGTIVQQAIERSTRDAILSSLRTHAIGTWKMKLEK